MKDIRIMLESLSFCHSAMGMGDAICGMYAACGLAEEVARNQESGSKEQGGEVRDVVRYYTRHPEWLACVKHPGVEVTGYRAVAADIGRIQDYKRQIVVSGQGSGDKGQYMGVSRKQFLCEVLAREFGAVLSAESRVLSGLEKGFKFSKFKPAAPSIVTLKGGEGGGGGVFGRARELGTRGGYALLAPFSTHQARSWGGRNWTELARELVQSGIRPVGIGTVKHRLGLQGIFKPIAGAKWLWGQSAVEVVRLVMGAAVVIGNDSGIVHLAGMLGVKTVCIHAGCLPHGYLFDLAPSVESVVCEAGWRRGDGTGLRKRVDHDTEALKSVRVERVIEAVNKIMGQSVNGEWEEREKTAEARRRTLLGEAPPGSGSKLDCLLGVLREVIVKGVAGEAGELGVYRGGSVAAMALVAREIGGERVVHAFDTFEGMPVAGAGDVHQVGEFGDVQGAEAYLAGFENVRVHKGVFPESAAGLEGERFAVVHLDADQYESTLAGLRWFWPRLNEGGVVVLDDWEWRNCPGVKRAAEEFLAGVAHARRRLSTNQMALFKII